MASQPFMEEQKLRSDVPAARYHYYFGVVQIVVASFAFIFSFFGCIFRAEYTVFGTGFYMFVFLLPPGIFGYMAGTRESQWHLARAFSLSVIASVACLMGVVLCVIEYTFLVPQYALYMNNFYFSVLRITNEAGQYQIAKTSLLLLGCILGGTASIIQTVIAWRDLEDPSRLKRHYHGSKRFPAPPGHFGQQPQGAMAGPGRYVHPPEAAMDPSGQFGHTPEVAVATPAVGSGYRV